MVKITLGICLCSVFNITDSRLYTLAPKLTTHTEHIRCSNRVNSLMKSFLDMIECNLLVHLVVAQDSATCLSSEMLKELSLKSQVVLTDLNTVGTVRDILRERPDVYILIINNFFSLNQIQEMLLTLMSSTLAWNPEGKVMLMLMSLKYHKQTRYQLVKGTFNYFWQRNILRMAIFLFEDEDFTLYSSSPYSRLYGTCREITDPAQLQEINVSSMHLSELNIAGYGYKTPNTFLGCPLIAYTFPVPPYTVVDMTQNDTIMNPKYKTGLEIELVILLAKRYNFSLNINTAISYLDDNAYIYKYPNGTVVGMFYDITQYKIDLAFAGSIPAHPGYYYVEFCYTQMMNTVSWYVVGGEPMTSLRLVTSAFTGYAWLMLAAAYICVSLLYSAVSKCTYSISLPEPTLLTMWRSLLGFSVHWTPGPSHLRLLLFYWTWFSLNIDIMFTTRLLSVMSERPLEHGLSTIQEMHKSHTKTCMPKHWRDHYLNSTEGLTKDLVEEADFCNNVEEFLEDFLENRNFSFLAKDDVISFHMDLRKVNVQRLEQKFITYPVTMVITKGSFLGQTLNKFIKRVFYAGLFHKWLRDLLLYENGHNHKYRKTKGKKKVILHFDDFLWMCYALLIGLTIAFVVFCFENLHKHNKRT